MKKLLATLLLGAALVVAALPVSAQGTDGTVTLEASGSTAAVSLSVPQEAAQGIKALHLAFEVESSDPVQAEFVFASSLPGSVQEYRYDADTGLLNVYVAGREELLPSGSAALGTIRLEASQGSTATVRVAEDSLELVDAALGKTEATTSSNGSVSLTVGNGGGSSAPETPAQPGGSQSSAGGSTSGQTVQTVQSSSVDDTTFLVTGSGAATQQTTAQKPSGGKNPAGSQNTAAPDSESAVTEEIQQPSTSAPATSPQESAEVASPEQAQPQQAAEGTHVPLGIIVLIVCLVAVVLIAIVVLRLRRR